jgi:hypothetical protein
MAVGNFKLGGNQVPVDLRVVTSSLTPPMDDMIKGHTYRFQVQLLDNSVEKFGRLAVRGHGFASTKACHLVKYSPQERYGEV